MTSPTSPIDTNETRGMPAPYSFERDTRPRSRSRSRSPHRRKSPSRIRSTSPYGGRRRDRRRSRSRSRSRSRRNSREFDRRRDVRARDRAGSRGSKSSRGSGRSRSRSPRRRDSPRSRDRKRSRSRSYERPHHGYYGHSHHDRPYDTRPDSYYGRGPPNPNPPPNPPPSRRRRRDTPPGASLLVRNLANEVTTQELHAAFARIGELRDVYIPLDYHSKLSKGFAFIEYANPEQARNAKAEMDKFVMKGRVLEVVFAQEKRKSPGEMIHRGDSPPRGGERGMYGGGGGGGGRSGGGGGSFDRSSSFERYRQREGRR